MTPHREIFDCQQLDCPAGDSTCANTCFWNGTIAMQDNYDLWRARQEIDITGVMRRLEASAPESTVFAFSRGSRTFVGASPERLVSLQGRELRTVAMAGSARRAADPAEDEALARQLLASDKEREEHRIVVRAILQALRPFCESLRSDAEPSVRELPNLLHMQTAIEGRLSQPTHVLSLVQALHPTPAVGGVPTAEAISWIVEHEATPRGWYSAPIGWTDASGDGEFVVIGGVRIAHERGLQAHSDGDVLIHAICDAMLGAAGLGDIGRHFPDSDAQYRDIDSRILLRQVRDTLAERGWRVENLDATLVAQAPRMGPHIDQMVANLAQDTGVSRDRVNVKATTTERMGYTGRGEGIAAHAVVLLSGL